MSKLAKVIEFVSLINEVQTISDKHSAQSILTIARGNKTAAAAVAVGLIGAGIASNVMLIKFLDKRGYKRTAKVARGLFYTGLAYNAAPYVRIAKEIANA